MIYITPCGTNQRVEDVVTLQNPTWKIWVRQRERMAEPSGSRIHQIFTVQLNELLLKRTGLSHHGMMENPLRCWDTDRVFIRKPALTRRLSRTYNVKGSDTNFEFSRGTNARSDPSTKKSVAAAGTQPLL